MSAGASRHGHSGTLPQVELIDILLASLEQLAATGRADAACRLAGQACAALRRNDPQGWRRFNALLHRLARHVL